MVAVVPIVPDIIGFMPVIMPDRSIIIAVVIALPFGVKLWFGGSRQSAPASGFFIMGIRSENAREK